MSETFQTREYWERRLRDHFGLEGVGYLRLGRRFNYWMYRIRGEVFDGVVRDYLGREQGAGGRTGTTSGTRQQAIGNRSLAPASTALRVLDVGAGTGFYVERWLRLGAELTGVDITNVAVGELRARFPAGRFLQGDIGEPLGGELARLVRSFDVVSAFDVLFHIVDDAQYAQALANIAALLRPDGLFLWSDNFIHQATVRVEHQVSRSLDEAAATVEAVGLEILERRPMFVLMNYPADTRSRWARLAWTTMVAPAVLSDWLGGGLGASLYPLERLLVRRVRESPSTEVMVCRRR